MAFTPSDHPTLQVLDVVTDNPSLGNGRPSKMIARRYSTTNTPHGYFTLLFAHGYGDHKEHWEPTIQRLFQSSFGSTIGSVPVIREAWAFDWQTHGDSAMHNAEALSQPHSNATLADWASAITDFIKTRLVSHRFICVGHSGGAIMLMNSTLLWPTISSLPYDGMVLVEPVIVDEESFATHASDRAQFNRLAKAIGSRRNEWESHEAAHAWFVKRAPWNTWDPRVVRILTTTGLRLVRSGAATVTTKCDRRHQAQGFSELPAMFQAAEQMSRICDYVPLHLVYGEHGEFPLKDIRRCTTDVAKGRRVASVSVVPGAGHMVVQQEPDRLAELLWAIIIRSVRQTNLDRSLAHDRPQSARL